MSVPCMLSYMLVLLHLCALLHNYCSLCSLTTHTTHLVFDGCSPPVTTFPMSLYRFPIICISINSHQIVQNLQNLHSLVKLQHQSFSLFLCLLVTNLGFKPLSPRSLAKPKSTTMPQDCQSLTLILC